MPTINQQKIVKSNITRNPEVTKVQILDAAESEFAVSGLGAAKTEAIAAQTGVTKAMIYYYFNSKEELYKAVLERCFLKATVTLQELQLDRLPPEDAMRRLLQEMLAHMSQNPHMGSILSLEAIQNKGKYYPKHMSDLLYGTLSQILEQGMKTGVFRRLEPQHTAVNIVGTCAFYFTAHENLKSLWPGKRLLSKDMLQRHATEAIDLIMKGISS